jgi:hypothetical protein
MLCNLGNTREFPTNDLMHAAQTEKTRGDFRRKAERHVASALLRRSARLREKQTPKAAETNPPICSPRRSPFAAGAAARLAL